jgi:hypothetical protein
VGAHVTSTPHNYWREDDRVVPAYALTQGRTQPPGRPLALESLITVTSFGLRHEGALQLESRAIVVMVREPLSVAEIGAALRVPIGVARVLVGDLVEAGYVAVASPVGLDEKGRPNIQTLERLLHGLRSR